MVGAIIIVHQIDRKQDLKRISYTVSQTKLSGTLSHLEDTKACYDLLESWISISR